LPRVARLRGQRGLRRLPLQAGDGRSVRVQQRVRLERLLRRRRLQMTSAGRPRTRLGAIAFLLAGCASSSPRSKASPRSAAAHSIPGGKFEGVVLVDVGINRTPLFQDELDVLRRTAYEFLSGRTELGRIVPLEELDRLRAFARDGRATEEGRFARLQPRSRLLFVPVTGGLRKRRSPPTATIHPAN
jgi:hypothetical protein